MFPRSKHTAWCTLVALLVLAACTTPTSLPGTPLPPTPAPQDTSTPTVSPEVPTPTVMDSSPTPVEASKTPTGVHGTGTPTSEPPGSLPPISPENAAMVQKIARVVDQGLPRHPGEDSEVERGRAEQVSLAPPDVRHGALEDDAVRVHEDRVRGVASAPQARKGTVKSGRFVGSTGAPVVPRRCILKEILAARAPTTTPRLLRGALKAARGTTSICVVSIRIPGPIVVETASVFTYLPLAADGFARRISSTTAR